jgi:cellulose synthase/poly-beta-1,6-N-acetylglucosamine synthase-like glycosyltransferase
MIYVFYFFAAVLVFLGCQSLRGGINYLKFFRRELAKPKSDYTPFCSVIAPCRGLDADLSENLSALFQQDFPNYEIVFVVDSEHDESVPVIKSLIAKTSESFAEVFPENFVSAKIIVAGEAASESQKVRNLRRAVLEVSKESEIFVFVDSDARPDADWLRNLIAPLQDKSIGCTTGYRWFVPRCGGFSTALRSIWNASIASHLGANQAGNFCWGGSMAIRRETFERLEIREKWRGTLSDDFAVTRAMKEADLPIYFVPQCLTATIEDCRFRELLEFSTRQMKITRVCAAPLWKASLLGSLLFTATFWTGAALLFLLSGWHFWLTLAFLSAIFWLGFAKAWLRLTAVKLVLKDYEKKLNKQFLPHSTFWTISPILYLYNSICALFSRKILWRGIKYNLKSATETEILSTNKS